MSQKSKPHDAQRRDKKSTKSQPQKKPLVRPTYEWVMEQGSACNFHKLAEVLAATNLNLYRRGDSHGLYQVAPVGNEPKCITTAKELHALLVETVDIAVIKNGKYVSDMPSMGTLNVMLCTESFLGAFRPVHSVVTSPAYLLDFSLTQPGYNPGGILYLGPPPRISDSMEFTTKFLDVMEWSSNADRTNAVAAALTVTLRLHWPGSKPAVITTAAMSGAGKGTVMNYVRGDVKQAVILYENLDWPMQQQLQRQLNLHPDIGVLISDNVRTDSSHSKEIRSGFLEGFVTDGEIILNAPGGGAQVRTPNSFVYIITTNEGVFSKDFLNRALPIHLAPKGDVTDRVSPIGDPKDHFLPKYRTEIDAELRGMVERWKKAGMPLLPEAPEGHRMTLWARTVGGILQENGFTDFLANYHSTRATYDPIGEALGILAEAALGREMTAAEWSALVVTHGLANTLFKPGSRDKDKVKAQEREMGWRLKAFLGHTVEAITEDGKRLRFKLNKDKRRWNGSFPHFRYWFEPADEFTEEAVKEKSTGTANSQQVGEDVPAPSTQNQTNLDQHQPENIPARTATEVQTQKRRSKRTTKKSVKSKKEDRQTPTITEVQPQKRRSKRSTKPKKEDRQS